MKALRSQLVGLLAGMTIGIFGFASHAEYYNGKTVSVLVGFPPGGGASLVVQNFAPFWTKHTPGNPRFIVKNMPGAGGSKAVNFMYDFNNKTGETILFSPSKIAAEVMKSRGQRAVHNKFEILGLVYDKYVAFSLSDVGTGLKKPTDIMKVGTIKMSARSPSSTLDVMGRAALDLLGIKYQFVCCYRGDAKTYAAMLSGEVQMANVGVSGYREQYEPQLVKKGKALALFHMPTLTSKGELVVPDPDFPDMPALSELYKTLHGNPPSGSQWEAILWLKQASARMAAAAPGTNKEAVSALRKGFIAAQKDPEFIAAHQKRFGTKWTYFSGEDGANVFNKIKNADPAVVKLLSTKYFTAKGKKRKSK
ncbi:MAG: hypothetical protein OXC28_22900 [Defluviicoccus sp.]|nr:hypothetical protein [Defluviicoccus sp.]